MDVMRDMLKSDGLIDEDEQKDDDPFARRAQKPKRPEYAEWARTEPTRSPLFRKDLHFEKKASGCF